MSRPSSGYGADDSSRPRPSYGYSGPDGHPGSADPALPGDGGGPDATEEQYGQVRRPPEGGPGPGSGGADDGYGSASGAYGASSPEDVPVCPRHPDRVAYVRCQRCHRPACPECQRPAAVGILCVDCARDIERQQRQSAPRTAMGGRTSTERPVVTIAIIAVCVVLYLGQMLGGGAVDQLLTFAPFRALAMPWTFITSGFLHASLPHILLNMMALWFIGPHLERTMGRWRFASVYLVSVLAGHVAVLLMAGPMSPVWFGGTVGASGGIFGLFGSLFVVNRRMGLQSGQVLVLIALNLVITFLYPHISWQGHLGGLVLGTATTALLFATRPRASAGADRAALARRSALIHAGVIACSVLLCLLLVVVKVAVAPAGAFGIL